MAFGGHRALKREINWLCEARSIVKAVIDNDPGFMLASERASVWRLYVNHLSRKLRRSIATCPPPLEAPLESFLPPDQKSALIHWLKQALDAIHNRCAIIRMAVKRAEAKNFRRLQGRVRAGKGSLTMDAIREALGLKQSRQQIWGI